MKKNIFLKQLFPAEKQPKNILEDMMAKKRKMIILDEYENEILEAYENGKLKPSQLLPFI